MLKLHHSKIASYQMIAVLLTATALNKLLLWFCIGLSKDVFAEFLKLQANACPAPREVEWHLLTCPQQSYLIPQQWKLRGSALNLYNYYEILSESRSFDKSRPGQVCLRNALLRMR